MSRFEVTDRTQLKRGAKRGSYDKEVIFRIMDEAYVCHVATQMKGRPLIQPTLHWRDQEYLYIHGSSKNGLFRALKEGQEAVIAITLLDGLVFAKSAFHHSVNYRSVMLYGQASTVDEPDQKRRLLDLMLEKIRVGRSLEARPPNDTEMKATEVLAFKISEVSAKVRTGGPVDDPEDQLLDIWSGVQPMSLTLGELVLE
ncbi:pyridoxamine 5'-phosphate oxidase family protein [uncultured Neptuniibacter sp.]|uniref:pyridoxamine 5'-phosphate oxidase family protein n=1 Tax=uncultured Neptuniibacter sp. TaxID=502143 RepID=UPI002610F511|nr:pyridoxamine 5'-phosphate oxidase family protein [uncultured Neptuniibacter sp.]